MTDDSMVGIEGECQCGNSDPSKFYVIRCKKGKLWGINCKKRTCGAEYLIKRFCKPGDDSITFDNQVLYYNPPISVEIDSEFQVRLSRKRVKDVADLKPGDHVGFDRLYLIWHHVIVEEVQSNPFKLVVEGWDGHIYDMRRMRKTLQKKDMKYMYKFYYSQRVENRNPAELVLARSASRLHADSRSAGWARPIVRGKFDEKYGFSNANCENFATYCKTGESSCTQYKWLKTKLKETVREFLMRSGKTFMKKLSSQVAPEVLENTAQFLSQNGSNFLFEGIGLVGVVGTELYSFRQAYKKLKDRLNSGDISKDVYHVELGKKAMEFLLVAGIAGGGGLVVASLGGPWWELALAPVLMIAAKAGNRFVTRVLGDGFLKYLGRACNWVGTTISGIKNYLVDKFKQCFQRCKMALSWVKKKVCQIAKSVFAKVDRIVGNAVEWLSSGWKYLRHKIIDAKDYLVAKLNQCLQNCKKALSWMKTKICELTKYIGSKVGKFAKQVVKSLASGWKWLQQKVIDSKNYLVDKFSKCWEWCKSVPKKVITKMSEGVNYVYNKLSEVANCVRKALAKPITAVVNAISKLFSLFS